MKIVKITNKDALSIPIRCLAFLAPKFFKNCTLIKKLKQLMVSICTKHTFLVQIDTETVP